MTRYSRKNCFEQIEGFGSYGFPESHAASFAQAGLCLGLAEMPAIPMRSAARCSTAQPMGFYAPAQIVGDARRSGVEVRPIDIAFSEGQCTLEERCGKYHAVRLGFRQIDGFRWADPDEERVRRAAGEPPSDDWAARIVAARARGAFSSLRAIRARHAAAEARADPARRCRCVPLAAARSPRGAVGGAAAARRRAAAIVRGRERARAARRGRGAAAANAARRTCGRRLSDRAAVAAGPSDAVFARVVCAGTGRDLPDRLLNSAAAAGARAAPAWCWCGSGRAAPRAWCSSRWRTRPASPIWWCGRRCWSVSAKR
ncbi:MAG: hypothetical protein MZV49_19020 [Rhodopseudomonas palustris]|nr:hypothetical protein [Rhodopseudomonas palustris]